MKFLVLTLFPEMFENIFASSILSRAQKNNLISISTKNIRDFATGKRKNVDDTPFGGGAGMLLTCDPLFKSIDYAKEKLGKKSKVIYLTPQGEKFTQKKAQKLAKEKENLILLCGHFEGIDERVREKLVDEEFSIGDYVLTGGEIPAMVMIDTISRLIPNVVGKEESLKNESFSEELFFQKEFPQYTRPANYQGLKVPKVLLGGNHAAIKKWQMENLRNLSETDKRVLRTRLEKLPVKSRNLIFRLAEKSDINLWMKWINDKKITKYLTANRSKTINDEENYYKETRKNLKFFQTTIVHKKTKIPIGNATLEIQNLNEKTAVFGFFIGEEKMCNQGFGTEILRTMLKFAFEDLKLEKVKSAAFLKNEASIKVHQKCGFREIGIQKKEFFKGDDFHDEIIFEILKEDYLKNK